MEVFEEDEDAFDVGSGNVGMPGKLVALIARVRGGEKLDFPIEIQKGRPV